MEKIFDQLRQRQIFKVAIIYVVAAWPIVQIADIAVPALGLPESVVPLLFKVFLIGFPISLIFGWLTNFTPDGLERAGIQNSNQTSEGSRAKINLRAFATVGGALLVATIIILGSQIFLGEQATSTEDVPEPPLTQNTDISQGIGSIAVLPFEVFSQDIEDEYFADGMVEELLNLLAKIPELSVAARTSSFAYKGVKDKTISQIAQELGVDTILEGSIRKNDVENRVRVTAQLIEAESGAHLFSETFDREYRDIFQIQDEIASLVTEKMKVTLLGKKDEPEFVIGTNNVDAMVEYGKGQTELSHRTATSIAKALDHFKTAVSLDENYARAYVGMSDATILSALYGSIPRGDAFAASQKALDKAFALNPDLGSAHASQGLLYGEMLNQDEAEVSFKKAIELSPNYSMAYMWYGSLRQNKGDTSGAHELFLRAYELDPKSPIAAFNVAWGYYLLGNEKEAMEWFTKILANDPYYPGAYLLVGNILRKNGRLDESSDMYQRALSVDKKNKSALSGLLTNAIDLRADEFKQHWFAYAESDPSILNKNDIGQLKARSLAAEGEELTAIEKLKSLEYGEDELHIKYLIDGEIAYYENGFESAVVSYEKFAGLFFDNQTAFFKVRSGDVAMHLAYSYQQSGMMAKAEKLLKDYQSYMQTAVNQGDRGQNYYSLALLNAIAGKIDSAIDYMQAAIDSGWVQTWHIMIEPAFAPMLTEAKFINMMGGVDARLAYMRTKLSDPEL